MLGTGPFAVPTFRALYDTGHTTVALVTAPLRTHRGQPVAPISSIRDVARQARRRGLRSRGRQRAGGGGAAGRLSVRSAGDLRLWADPRAGHTGDGCHGGVNLHASLLPKYRGAAPINWPFTRARRKPA